MKPTLISSFMTDKNVASVARTSKKTVERICRAINFDKDIVLVEYGPGSGAFTKYLLSRMSLDSKLIAIEKNKKLASALRNLNDERLEVVEDSAENMRRVLKNKGIEYADYIVSGIPLSFLNPNQKTRILSDTHKTLIKGGKLLVYQASKKHEGLIQEYFRDVNSYPQPVNIPPLFVFEATK